MYFAIVCQTEILASDKEELPNFLEVIQILDVYIGKQFESVDILNCKNQKLSKLTNNRRLHNRTLLGRSTVLTSLITSRV